MKKIIIITILFGVFGLGCTKLDEEIYDKIPGDLYPEDAQQVALLGVDAYKQLQPLADDEGWWFLAQEISSDEFCGPTRDADWFDGGKWLNVHRHDWSNDDESVNRMWDKFFSGVTTSNQIIDLLNKLEQNESILNKKAEIAVMRSFYYYLILDNYGAAPYLTSAENAPAQPYKISREALYDSIVSTVERSLPRLQVADKKYLATRYMAFALLSKLYLNSNIYKYGGGSNWGDEALVKANAYCDSVLAGPYSLSATVSAPFITENQNSSEIIFSIPYDEDNFQGFRLHMRTLHYQMNLKYDMPVGPWNGLCVTPNFFDTYEESDLRREAYHIFGPQFASDGSQIIDGLTEEPLNIDPHLPALYMTAENFTQVQIRATGARVGKYEIKMGAKENLSNDFPLFRITDFYLMKAEIEIRLNGAGSGDQWINPIRERAGVSTWTGATLDDLLSERGRELYCEGHRRQDLIRYGKFTEPWWEKTVTGDPSVTLFPIPKWATDANPNLLLDPQ
ncbi:MAG: RagB/SusD family nutrient uptake outer membrane protein [Bacteroidales bacterium]|nr:RagB/SusD family nutrient uptake outer membrane protein [Bacteroidales bacterium]